MKEYRNRLLKNILQAHSPEEVKQSCDNAIKGLEQHKVNGHLVSRFIDRIMTELQAFDPIDCDAQQWSNIRFARVRFRQIKGKVRMA